MHIRRTDYACNAVLSSDNRSWRVAEPPPGNILPMSYEGQIGKDGHYVYERVRSHNDHQKSLSLQNLRYLECHANLLPNHVLPLSLRIYAWASVQCSRSGRLIVPFLVGYMPKVDWKYLDSLWDDSDRAGLYLPN